MKVLHSFGGEDKSYKHRVKYNETGQFTLDFKFDTNKLILLLNTMQAIYKKSELAVTYFIFMYCG